MVTAHLPSSDEESSGYSRNPQEGHRGRGLEGDGAELSLRGQTGIAGLGHGEVGRVLRAEGAVCAEVRRGLVCSGKHM